jgi:hypothetical protein
MVSAPVGTDCLGDGGGVHTRPRVLEILTSDEFRQKVTIEIRVELRCVEAEVVAGASVVDAVVPHEHAQWIAVYSVLVDVVDSAISWGAVAGIDEADEFIHDQIRRHQVLQLVGLQIDLYQTKHLLAGSGNERSLRLRRGGVMLSALL